MQQQRGSNLSTDCNSATLLQTCAKEMKLKINPPPSSLSRIPFYPPSSSCCCCFLFFVLVHSIFSRCSCTYPHPPPATRHSHRSSLLFFFRFLLLHSSPLTLANDKFGRDCSADCCCFHSPPPSFSRDYRFSSLLLLFLLLSYKFN